MARPDLADRVASWLLTRPRLVLALLVAIAAASAAALPFLRVDSGLERPFMNPKWPEHALHEEVKAHFVGDQLLFVAYETPDVFSRDSLLAVRQIGEHLDGLTVPGTERSLVHEVTSLATVEDVEGGDMTYRTVPLVPEAIPEEPAALRAIRGRAQGNPLIRSGLLSETSDTVAALTVRLADDLDEQERAGAVEAVRGVLAGFERPGAFRAYMTGLPVIGADAARYMKEDLGRFIPIIYVLVTLLLFLFLRRVLGVVVALVNVTVAFLGGMAALVVVGGAVNNLSTMIPPVMMVLSVATVVHFFSELAKHSRAHGEAAAAHATLRELLAPAFMCELTTAVGFISLGVSSIPALREFGFAAAGGVMLSFVTSFLLLALAARWRPSGAYVASESAPLSEGFDRLMARTADIAIARPWPMLAVSATLLLAAAAGIARLVVDNNDLDNFTEDAPVRQATEFVQERLGGTSLLVVSIKAPRPEQLIEPAELQKLEALEAFLAADAGADHVDSLADWVKLMHRGFSNNEPSAHRIPDSREQVAQLLMLNGDETLREFVDPTHQWVRVVARLREHSSARLTAIYDRVDAYLARQFPEREGYRAHATGTGRQWVATGARIVASQTGSLGLSFLLIFAPIFLLFRSLRTGLFSIPSNVFPIAIVIGLMGWAGINLDVATAMIGPVVLGIAVDDTIHFLEYMRGRLREHGELERAIRETFRVKGVGALWTVVIVSLGFSVVLFSHFPPTRNFGLLTAAAMLSGIVGELLLLPPLLVVTRTRLGVRPATRAAPASRAAGG